MKIKKIFGMVLCAVMLFECIPQVISAETSVAVGLQNKVGILGELGISCDDLTADVTRGKFITSIMSVMQLGTYSLGGQSFEDVSETDTELYSAVEYALRLRIISSAQYFEPERVISYGEAAKMAVEALGYGDYARSSGGYPTGYLTVISQLKADKGIGKSDSLSGADMLIFLENILNTEIKTVSSVRYDGKISEYTLDTSESFLEAYRGIRKVKGIVTAANGGSLYDSFAKLPPNAVAINGNNYLLRSNVICPLGYYVQAYVDEQSYQPTVICTDLSDNNVTTVFANEIEAYSGYSLKYWNKIGKSCTLNVDRNAAVLYNGKAYEDCSNDEVLIEDGYVDLIDNNKDGRVDVLAIWEAAYLKVDYINKHSSEYSHVFYDKNKENTIYLDVNNMSYMCNIDINNIQSGNILECFVSRDKSFVKINCITSFSDGIITEVSTDGSLKTDGQLINVTNYFKRHYENNISLGGKYSLALNLQGQAVAIGTSAGAAGKLAYFDNMQQKDDISKSVLIKLFCEDGNVLTAALADKVLINGENKNKDEAHILLQNYMGGMIRYQLDDSEKIFKIIVTSKEGTYDAAFDGVDALKRFRFIGDDTDKKIYYKKFGYFVPYFILNSATKIFIVATGESDDAKRFAMGDLSFLSNDEQVPSNSVTAYNVSVAGSAGVLLYKSDNMANVPINVTSSAAMVAGMSTTVNEDGESILKIKLYAQDKYFYYYIKKDANFVRIMNLQDGEYPFSTGDVIRYGLDQNKEYMLNAIKDYDSKTKTLLYNADYNTELQYFYGSVYAIDSTSIAVKCPDDTVVYVPFDSVNVGLCEEDEVLTAPRNQIQSYFQVGENCDKILIKCRYASPNEVFVFR